MSIRPADAKQYFDAVMNYCNSLADRRITKGVVRPSTRPKTGDFVLPEASGYKLKGDSSEAIEAYYNQLSDANLGGIEFSENGGIIFLLLKLDMASSQSKECPQARSFSYQYVVKYPSPYYVRIEMDPLRRGQSFNHPVLHVHLSRSEPRMSICQALSPVEFIDFIIRSFYPDSWRALYDNCEDHLDALRALTSLSRNSIAIRSGYEAECQRRNQMLKNSMNLATVENHIIQQRYPFKI